MLAWLKRFVPWYDAPVCPFKVGDRICLVISDPWDLVTDIGSGPFVGVIGYIRPGVPDGIVIQLDPPLLYKGFDLSNLWAQVRHINENFVDDWPRSILSCNLVSVNRIDWEVSDFDGVYDFTDRIGLIGSLELLAK